MSVAVAFSVPSRGVFVKLPPGRSLCNLLGFIIADISSQYFSPL